jgi:Flp pilus assembly protein TadG
MERDYKSAGVLCSSLWRLSTGMLTCIVGLSRTFQSSRRGSVAIQMAILMTVLIGMAGLGTEVPYMMYKHRQMQTAADSAALGAAVALAHGYPAIATEADGIAAALGFTNGTGSVTVTVNNPPKSGNYTTNSSAVEVIVTQPQTLKMAGLFGVSVYNLSARAVAIGGAGTNGYCILSLDNSSGIGVGLWGGVQLWMNWCGIAANSSGAGALTLQSGGTLTAAAWIVPSTVTLTLVAPTVSLVGQLNNVWSNVWATVKQNQPAVADPYANVAMPASTGCDYNNFGIGYTANQTTLYPGRYCNGLWIGNGANVALAPGIYYIKSGSLSMMQTTNNIVGTGVTFVLTTADGANSYADVQFNNGVVATLSAPTSGPTAGILFFGDRNAPSSVSSSFSAFGYLNLTGAIYLPTQTFTYAGGGWIDGCTQLIAWDINDYLNVLWFDGTCMGGTGMKTIGASSTVLVE